MDLSPFGVLFANRYLSAVAVAVMLWDHMITLDEEYRVVWSNRRERVLWKVGFVVCRYTLDAVLLFTAYSDLERGLQFGQIDVGGHFCLDIYPLVECETPPSCGRWIWCFALPLLYSTTFTQALVGYRVLTLWAHRRAITYLIFGVFSIFVVASGVLVIFVCIDLQSASRYINLGVCIIDRVPQHMIWHVGLLMAFELYLIAMTIVNTLDTPRTRDVEILRRLNRDGGLSFLGNFVILLALQCLYIWDKQAVGYALLPPGWAFWSVITSRLFFRVNISGGTGAGGEITLNGYNLPEKESQILLRYPPCLPFVDLTSTPQTRDRNIFIALP
ncbi:hypothetical protein P691DRAFT_763197 [Macrolepiota fuliginosa MF-IS2]|uniref:DUF6533 domain-containing protein n=1 Tax=Macrolepiota fuliginosa MF-IS2 TaxID=1400762 RepID=A0A9P5X6M8_9AGAR|nr:hypothetical protein P691DRAFT_763197 [Macrolepiota fuliginosa MF-IS2]